MTLSFTVSAVVFQGTWVFGQAERQCGSIAIPTGVSPCPALKISVDIIFSTGERVGKTRGCITLGWKYAPHEWMAMRMLVDHDGYRRSAHFCVCLCSEKRNLNLGHKAVGNQLDILAQQAMQGVSKAKREARSELEAVGLTTQLRGSTYTPKLRRAFCWT